MSSDQRTILDEILHAIGQEHLLAAVQSESEIAKLLREVQGLDLPLLFKLQQRLKEAPPSQNYIPPTLIEPSKECIDESRFGCLIVAGGQASRIRMKGAKGCLPTSLIAQKTLFQIHAEKIRAASKQRGHDIALAIMTSPGIQAETEIFFQQHAYFGLKPALVSFFSQTQWPLLDFEGNLFLNAPGKLARGPNGNGDVYKRFVKSGIWQRWKNEGIEHVRIMPVDNPLALPVNHELFATHLTHGNDITIQAVEKQRGEKAGTLSLIDGKLGVIEYGELEHEVEQAYANIGLFAFSMSFMKRASEVKLPLHVAKKAVKTLDGEISAKPNACKFETYIFDAFYLSEKTEAFPCSRHKYFAPLKNLEGEGSISTVCEAVLANEREIFTTITGNPPPKSAQFELGADFYYPTDEQLQRWKGKQFPGEQLIEDL